MTDNLCSPIRELNLLKEFDDSCSEPWAHWDGWDDFGALTFLRDEPELSKGLIGFAAANGSGSLFVLWKRPGVTDLAGLPVLLLGDEGGLHLVASNLREFLRLLGALESDLACDWESIFERDAYEVPDQDRYLAWLKETFGLTPPEDAWDIIRAAQREVGREWAAWIHPLMPDAVFSTVHELNLLKSFQDWEGGDFAGEVFLDSPQEVAEDGDIALIPFATANTDGDSYALWRREEQAAPSELPVMLLGEGDERYVVARDAREFLQLLGALDGVEIHWPMTDRGCVKVRRARNTRSTSPGSTPSSVSPQHRTQPS